MVLQQCPCACFPLSAKGPDDARVIVAAHRSGIKRAYVGGVLIGNRAFNHGPSLLITLALINGRKMTSLRSFALPLHYVSLCSYVLSVSFFLSRFIMWTLF